MYLLREKPEVYRERYDTFMEMATFLDLTDSDRHLAWREATEDEDWHEWPVPMTHFIDDPYYIGTDIVVRPAIRSFLLDFFDEAASYQLWVFIGGIGAGKAADLDTPVATPGGWTTMGALRVGDRVLDENGAPTRVTWTSPVWTGRPCFRVTFDDGSSAVVDAEHEWSTLTLTERKRADAVDWRDAWDRAGTRDMLEIASGLRASNGQAWHAIPNARPLDLPERELPIDPYVLGAWLGDGTAIHGAITCADTAIIEKVRSAGQEARMRPSTAGRAAPCYGLIGLAPQLRAAGVLGDKHIPGAYLRASRQQRLALLRGLMDTDGFNARHGSVGIDLCNERLAKDVAELVRTLGWKATLHANPTSGPWGGGTRWRTRFTPDECPFHLKRKAQAWSPSRQAIRATARFIVSVEPVEPVATRCISVASPSHLYLLGEQMVPTHNSFSASISITYALYLLSCMKRPQAYLSTFPGCQLSNDAEIVLMNASAAGADQSRKIVYGEAFEKIQKSPYFRTHFAPAPRKSSELDFPGRIRLSPGTSRWESALGWNLFGFAIDEAAFGQQTERADYVKELFLALNQRRRSRFGPLGFGGMFTSPGSESGFVELIADDAKEWDASIMVRRITTWDAKDELQPGSSVFLLDRDPDQIRIIEKDLTYAGPGVGHRKNGEVVRWGETPPMQEPSEDEIEAEIAGKPGD